jgi:hypothetical protein
MVNPYQSPAAVDDAILATEEESLVTERIRWAVLLLSIGAFCNLACIVGPWARVSWISYLFAFWDVIWVGTLCVALWRFGPGMLEWLAIQLHRLFGGTTSLDAWLTTYRQSLWPLPIAAGIGLLLRPGHANRQPAQHALPRGRKRARRVGLSDGDRRLDAAACRFREPSRTWVM